MEVLSRYFHVTEENSTVSTEILAGLSTFFSMSYIIFVVPSVLSQAGMPYQAAFLATIFSSVISTLFIGLFANVPYALAPGMGLNAFFTYTVVMGLGFTWQEGLAMVFVCGVVNIIVTVTKLRRFLIAAIPVDLQQAISGGVGLFIAYIGVKSAGFINFSAESTAVTAINGQPYTHQTISNLSSINMDGSILPSISNFTDLSTLLALLGLILMTILMVKKNQGAILIGIVGIVILNLIVNPSQVSTINFAENNLGTAFQSLGSTFGVAFTQGFGSLFSDFSRLPLVLMTIFAFSLSDIFDTIGTFIGTGRSSGIFSEEELENYDRVGNKMTKFDRAMFGDVMGTSIGAIFGTSNTTVFAESGVGIANGGRTGLTAVVVSMMFTLCIFLSPLVGLVPGFATAPALIIVGVLMMSSFREVNWDDLAVAIPAFLASAFMAYSYSITNGIAAGFIFYCLTKTIEGKAKEIHPVLWVVSILFLLNFVIMAVL